ncbi:MAG: glycosyltransferase family 4 protein [Rhodanobacteraceae bacterium]|nr:glycosyltransferase family 4 protein [Rhodanobacteraceae bacterium]
MYGGGQRVAIDIRDWSRRNGQPCNELIALGDSDPNMAHHADLVIQYDGRYNRPSSILAAAWRLRKKLDEFGWPRVLHSHGWDADCIVALARIGRSSRHCVHLHLMADWLKSGSVKSALKRWLTRRLFKRSGTRVIAVSRAVADHWQAELPLAGEYAPVPVLNGIDVARFGCNRGDQVRNGPVVLAVAARLAPKKGLEVLLMALARLSETRVDFVCRVAGSGPLLGSLQRRVAELALDARLQFCGHVEDMHGFYADADIYIQPSETEGLPLGLLEALASGLAAVATDVGGTREVLRDGIEGYLIRSGDPAALADALATLIGNKGLRLEMGLAARARVCAEFSLDCFGRRVQSVYRELTEPRDHRSGGSY